MLQTPYRAQVSQVSTEQGLGHARMEFQLKEKPTAELWAWLLEGYAVSSLSKTKSDRKIEVLSKDDVKNAIQVALRNSDSERAQELLDIASSPNETVSQSMVRKSIRVSPGEYVKLLYLKMFERTSFADIMMKVLTVPCKEFVKELLKENQPAAAEKLNHLAVVIESWEREKPESRANIAEWGDWTKSSFRSSSTRETTGSCQRNGHD